jgi:hypothetical protein
MAMMLATQHALIPALAVEEEACDPRDRRGARTRGNSGLTVRLAHPEALRHIPALAPREELRKRADIAEEVGDLTLSAACEERPAQSLEALVSSPAAFGEGSLGHNGATVHNRPRCVNVLKH